MSLLEQAKKFFQLTEQDLKDQIILKKKGNVFFLIMNTKANVFNKTFVRGMHKKMDEVQLNEGPTSLVVMSLSKIFSGGLDLKFVSTLDLPDQRYFVLQAIALMGRIAIFPTPTIALVKGGAIAGGCMLSFSHDFIFTAGNAVFGCNQVDMGLPLPPGMNALVKKKHNTFQTFRDMVLLSKRFNQDEALSVGITDKNIKENALQVVYKEAEAISKYGENKINYKKLKEEMFKEVTDCCFNKQHAVGIRGQTFPPPIPKL